MSEFAKKSYKKGARIYLESEEDSGEVFVIEKGEVELEGFPGLKKFRSSLGSGDIFGFTSCLCRRPRMETVVARTDCTCAVLGRDAFIESVQGNPELATRVMSYFADELRAYDDMVAVPSEKAAPSDEEARLFELGMHFARVGREAHALYALSAYLDLFPSGASSQQAQKAVAGLRAKGVKSPAAVQQGLARQYADGQMVFCEHEPGKELFIVKSGKVEILKVIPPDEMLLSILREGDIFGELSIVSSKPRNATAFAIGQTELLPVARESLSVLFEKSPVTIARILTAISQRLWFTFIRLQSSFYENPLTRAYVLLENKLMEERISLLGTKPVTLPLGIGEILGMAGVPADQQQKIAGVLTDDRNLSFQFRQVTIENPSALESRARYFRTRDHLGSQELKGSASAVPRRKGEETRPTRRREETARGSPIGLDSHELRVPLDTLPEK
ncbi:MAG TPA: cyclic nucleotide-binding domain-containing protein [Spirochaetia bacterium]|nr:cyclic nucleotide-binding domain-containing protein [Spirochaetia bacterium]